MLVQSRALHCCTVDFRLLLDFPGEYHDFGRGRLVTVGGAALVFLVSAVYFGSGLAGLVGRVGGQVRGHTLLHH